MSLHSGQRHAELNTSSMADIAFLLMTFFMITTDINQEKGLAIELPPSIELPPVLVHERNVFKIRLNSLDQLMVRGSIRTSTMGLTRELKTFILNNGADKNFSESPDKAVISLRADRGSSYKVYIAILDQIQSAYYEIYAGRAGLTAKQFRSLDLSIPQERILYKKAKEGVPMNISIAE